MSAEPDWEALWREGEPYDALFPTGRRWVGLHWHEIRSAVGREGLTALATYVAAVSLLAAGFWVSIDTWADRGAGRAKLSLVEHLWFVEQSPALNLGAFWIGFLAAFGLVGWLLSRRVTKGSLRIYVAFALVVMTLLLITIGRNGNFESAEASARADARRLLEAEQRTDDETGAPDEPGTSDEGTPAFTVGQALLLELCEESGLTPPDSEPSSDDQAEPLPDDEPDRARCGELRDARVDYLVSLEAEDAAAIESRRPLSCLEGWTLGAFDRWMDAASYDRRIVALGALASCEIGAPDPSAETADGSVAEAVGVVPATLPEGESAAEEPATTAARQDQDTGDDRSEDDDNQLDAATSGAASSAVLEALRTQRSEVRAYEAIALGADEVLSFVSGPAHFAEFRFSGLAWLALLGLVFVWYRHLEIRSGEGRLGPVDVQFESVDGTGNGAADELRRRPASPTEALFKESVIRNVPEPGAVPGSGALAPVGDLVAEADLPQGRLANGVISLLQTVFATRGGFTVTCSIRREQPRCAVFVRLRDTRTGTHVISHVFEDESPDNAARLAGYWIAGYILSRSDYVPNWAKWSEDDAASFVQMGWVQGDGLSLTITEAPESDDGLKTVNSLLLAQRAYTNQIGLADRTRGRANHLAALEDFARAVNRQPRYPVARYRRGVVLGTMMLMGENLTAAQGGQSPQMPTPSRLRYLFGDLILGDVGGPEQASLELACSNLHRGENFDDAMRNRMLVRVAEWSTQNRASLRWRWLARLRPSERFFWKSFSHGALEKDWARVLDLERCIAAERIAALRHERNVRPRPTPAREKKLENLENLRRRLCDRAAEPDSHWQLSYNLACLYAIRLSATDEPVTQVEYRNEALIWLQRALDRPYSAQLVRRWIRADGDLKPLRELEEFEELVRRVPEVKPAATVGFDAAK